jgi:hypothetical protein
VSPVANNQAMPRLNTACSSMYFICIVSVLHVILM